MVDPNVREASQRAAAERARRLAEAGLPEPRLRPGGAVASTAEERVDIAPEPPPPVRPEVRPEDVPEQFAGALPENMGRDPSDIHRDRGKPRGSRRR